MYTTSNTYSIVGSTTQLTSTTQSNSNADVQQHVRLDDVRLKDLKPDGLRRRKWAIHVTQHFIDRQQGRCAMCRDELHPHDMERDHIVPLCRGGADTAKNIQVLCGSCHNIKTKDDLRWRQIDRAFPIKERSPYFTDFEAVEPFTGGFYPFISVPRRHPD